MINVDSTIHDGDIVTAASAARLLGVKRATLYAYASRGLLTRVAIGRGRASGYLRADVERLKARSAARAGHGAVASGALRWGEPVLDSAVTRIDPAQGPIYRGRAAVDLAQSESPFEDVASRLWQSASPAPWTPIRGRRVKASASLSSLALSVASLGFGETARTDLSREDEADLASRLIIALAGARACGPSVAEALVASVGAARSGGRAVRAVNCALVLAADHELNASTFAARIAASAGADLFACLTAAIATLSGRRHGGECDRVEALVREVGTPRSARSVVLARTQHGDLLPGFGHPLYPDGDPRALPLLAAARALAPNAMRTLDAIVREAREVLGLKPTLDVGLVAIARAIGVPAAASAIFALGRCAGWTAHVIEQREAGFLLRPRARYLGETT